MAHQTLYPSQTAKLKIVAPMGGFANHIRWLILLDECYSFSICATQDYYKIFSGPGWPTYENYCCNDLHGIKQEIVQELHQLSKDWPGLKVYKFFSNKDKKKLIDEHVYPENRTWQNWLNFEWKFRYPLNNAIPLHHEIEGDTIILPGIYINTESQFALRSYIKFNSNLNNLTVNEFTKKIDTYKVDLDKVNKTNNLIINASEVMQSNLDPQLYTRIMDYIGIPGNYDLANYAHKKWYNLQCRAEKEIGQFFTNLYQ